MATTITIPTALTADGVTPIQASNLQIPAGKYEAVRNVDILAYLDAFHTPKDLDPKSKVKILHGYNPEATTVQELVFLRKGVSAANLGFRDIIRFDKTVHTVLGRVTNPGTTGLAVKSTMHVELPAIWVNHFEPRSRTNTVTGLVTTYFIATKTLLQYDVDMDTEAPIVTGSDLWSRLQVATSVIVEPVAGTTGLASDAYLNISGRVFPTT